MTSSLAGWIGSAALALLLTAREAPAAPPTSTAMRSPWTVEVFVALCDSALVACGRGAAGDPRSLDANLYWGALYGAERHLTGAAGFHRVSRRDAPDPSRPFVLRETEVVREAAPGERPVRLVLRAYAGDRIDDALADFLAAAAGASAADLVVWVGHDRLMDVPPPRPAPRAPGKPVAALACSTERFFGPVLRDLGAVPVVLTRTFMAPEGYLLEALAEAVARHGPRDEAAARALLVRAYARYQRISEKAAATVFTPLRGAGAPRAPSSVR